MARFRASSPGSRTAGRAPARVLAGLAIVAGGVLLIAAEPLTLREIRLGDAVVAGGRTTAGAHHGYALAVLGVAMLALGATALARGSAAAAAGALLMAVIAAWVVAGVDGPALDDAGLVPGARGIARAHAGPAWHAEIAGAVLALAGAGGALALAVAPAGPRAAAGRGDRARRGRR